MLGSDYLTTVKVISFFQFLSNPVDVCVKAFESSYLKGPASGALRETSVNEFLYRNFHAGSKNCPS